MNAIYRQAGDRIDYTPAADVAAGEVVVIEDLVGVTLVPIPDGTQGALALTGVFEIAKKAADNIAAGKKVHYHKANKEVQLAGGTGTVGIGFAAAAAPATTTTVQVRLQQGLVNGDT